MCKENGPKTLSVNGKEKNLHIAYIGGGSRGWAWGFMMDLAMDEQLCGSVHLYDIDRDAAERNRIIGRKISAHPDAKAEWSYHVADSLKEALTGADFVVISILPGTFDEMASDVHLPERVGVYQPVGDTVGPGGFMRAMRTIPMFVEIGQAIRDYAPDAWVINYTNPMTLSIRTLYEVFPGIKAFGCCHEVFGTQSLLCKMIADELGIENVDRHELYTTVTGINHFTWLTRATYKDVDLMPLYAEFARKHADGYDKGGDKNWMNSSFASADMVKFDLFNRYGAIAAAGDRHLTEFLPQWYNKDPETVRRWKFGLTTVEWRKEDLKRRMQRSDDLISGKEELKLRASGEEGHLLIKAILGLGDIVSNVNVPNRGQIPNLPMGAVVETNALFGYNRIEPICAGPVPANILPLIARHVYNQENTLRAALDCDRKLGLSTFMNDPLMGAVMPEEGEKLFNDMLENQRKYLPAKWFE
ncbi:MAG: alpha-glucosidase/alpha-galactosidase [Clostridia bacterium]|nr:alpha-glucosidase/alpha-galactosidase [Clostridia bacterium]